MGQQVYDETRTIHAPASIRTAVEARKLNTDLLVLTWSFYSVMMQAVLLSQCLCSNRLSNALLPIRL